MLISNNTEPCRDVFEKCLLDMVNLLHEESKENQKYFLGLTGNNLESVVHKALSECSKNTPFEGTIELISGQKFPDIIAKKFYGLEVKTTKANKWSSIGSSIAEGTRVEGIERIFLLFGKMCNPIEFKCRLYEECLSDVLVTHSPRYSIDMLLKEGETFFDKINIPYNELRSRENPIETVVNYYRNQLKDGQNYLVVRRK